MKRFIAAFLGLAVCLTLTSAVAMAAPGRGVPKTQRYVTVGEFAVQLAKGISGRADTLDGALATLRNVGINVNKGDLGRTLTQGDVVSLLTMAGIKVTAKDPMEKIDPSRAESIARTFSPELSRSKIVDNNGVGVTDGTQQNPNDDFNNGNGSGGKYKRKKKNSQTGSD